VESAAQGTCANKYYIIILQVHVETHRQSPAHGTKKRKRKEETRLLASNAMRTDNTKAPKPPEIS
jgi:hypothetical protein